MLYYLAAIFIVTISSSGVSLAQANAGGWVDVTEGASLKNVGPLDEDLFPSVRGAGMSRALETTADDMDAAVFNPAGIGGLHPSKEATPILRRLYFPWAAVVANQNAIDLYQEFGRTGAAGSSAVGRAIIDAEAGKRQYTRAALTSGIVLGRAMVVPINDHQVAAASSGDGSGLVEAHYRGTTGFGLGGSVQSSDGRLTLGYFGYQVDRKEIQGIFDYSTFIDADILKSVVKPYSRTLRGTGHSVGVMWRPGKNWSPTLGMSLKNMGNTRFRDLTGGDPTTLQQNLSLGASISPKVSRASSILVSLGAERLNDFSQILGKKAHLGLEYAIGGFGNYATFTLRAGVSAGGGSLGIGAHLGLVGFQIALQSLDIGAGNQKVIEQRRSLNLYVNVAEF